ncbi:unnamed protein product [Meganyctiphanes norvegica]|uniref:Prokineticin domain-containing protein n=1 Tax=Meganyctiphanes norvegica TaxID=48144 RepID=A0AAV2S9R4_MEGNR
MKYLTIIILTILATSGVQGLMFPPEPGPSCADNIDCSSGCCLMTGRSHRRPVGICQPVRQMGEYCAPGNRLRDFYVSRVYTYSCPCAAGLTCKPAWSKKHYGMNVVEDPKCMPENMHPYVLHMKGDGYNTGGGGRHPNAVDIIPAQ